MDSDVLMFSQVMFVIVASVASFVAIGLATRALWNRGSRTRPGVMAPDDVRMQRLETAVDTIAIEVERISEAQRFMVTLLGDALPGQRAPHTAKLASSERSGRVITPV